MLGVRRLEVAGGVQREMLSYTELERAARVISERFAGFRLQAVVQPDAHTLVLSLYGRAAGAEAEASGGRHALLLSCEAGAARISEVDELPRALPAPPALAQYLRAHAVGHRFAGARIVDGDRQLALRFEAPGDAAGGEGVEILLSIFGPRSNLYALDRGARLVACARPLAETRSELALGGAYVSPASRPPTRGGDRFADVDDAGLLGAIEAHYAEQRATREPETGAARVEKALRKQRKQLERKLEKLTEELDAARRDTLLERQGELLKGALARVARGDRELRVDDPVSGERVRIALDPTLAPSENLEKIFQRYRKALRALAKGGAQEDAVRGELAECAALEAELAQLSGEQLAAFEARPALQSLLRRFAPPPAASAGASAGTARPRGPDAEIELAGRRFPARLAPRRFRSLDGLEIWVGRSDAANDFLSTRLAHGNDLFFHLDGAPGSHVVLRTGGRPDPPSESLLDACELAIHYSKAKNSGRADVHVVPIKNVRKPKGAKPGLVHVHGGKTIHLRRSDARLERLLASKIED
jgi:predicted ribosome quality control (RQC) complex YloA/Tae2 family protein